MARPPNFRKVASSGAIVLCTVSAVACAFWTSPGEAGQIVGTAPVQISLRSGPTIARLTDSAILIIEVTALDSALHRTWTPTAITVETSRGHVEEMLLVPFACLVPKVNSVEPYPLNFKWMACNRVGFNSQAILSDAEIRQLESSLSGRRILTFAFQTRPGAQYQFQVPPGISSTAEALRRLEALRPRDELFHPSSEPACVASDVQPAPPCPPWTLFSRRAFSFGQVAGDSLPVESGGWVEARYTDRGGTLHVSRLTISQN